VEVSCQLHTLVTLSRGKSSPNPVNRNLGWP